jgi:16S rRNA G966 N2-methylase RsmD
MMSQVPPEQRHPIDYPLVAKPHSGLYRMHQYRSRKPENVVARYISHYTAPGEIVLDPFSGSGVSAIEAIRLGRKGIAIDLDPVATFITRWTVRPLNLKRLRMVFARIREEVQSEILATYHTRCIHCESDDATISHTIWKEKDGRSEPVQIWYDCGCRKKRSHKRPDADDLELIQQLEGEEIPHWYPTTRFHYDGKAFMKMDPRAHSVDALFSRRNLRALARLWEAIVNVAHRDSREFLKFVFTSNLAMASKMNRKNVGGPQSKGRGWTVHAYWIPKEHFEQNVWDDFERRFNNLVRLKERGMTEFSLYREARRFSDLSQGNANVWILTRSALGLRRVIPDESIDYIFTDPPYAGTIQYLELSTMWAAWLGLDMNYREEVTINEQQEKSFEDYHRMLHSSFREMYRVLKTGHWLTVTFHSTNVRVYNSIIRAAVLAGFDLIKIVYQPPSSKETFNRTLNPHGTAEGDYYIQFHKPERARRTAEDHPDREQYRRVVIEGVKRIIAERGEPTPYQVIFNGIYSELDRYGYLMVAEPEDIKRVMEQSGEFEFFENEGWWLAHPEAVRINLVPLHERVEKVILQKLRREVAISFDDALQEIFLTFQNALTPNPPSVKAILEEYADALGDGTWQLKPEVRQDETDHSRMIGYLGEIGKKAGFDVWIGLPEQSAIYRGEPLAGLSEPELRVEGVDADALGHLKRVDVLWLKRGRVALAFEVEHTTVISEAIVRGSYYPDPSVRRFFVIPRRREALLHRKVNAPIFRERMQRYGWGFILFRSLERFRDEHARQRQIHVDDFVRQVARELRSETGRQIRITAFEGEAESG